MQNKNFNELIDEAVITEEEAIPVYGRHLKTVLFWSGLPKNKQKLIKIYLDILMNDTRKHIKIFKAIRGMGE